MISSEKGNTLFDELNKRIKIIHGELGVIEKYNYLLKLHMII